MSDIMIFKNTVNVPSGLDRVAKMIYGALARSKTIVPFVIKNPDLINKTVEEKRQIRNAKYNFILGVPYSFQKYVEPGKINIGYTMWETDRIPESFKESLSCLDLVLVPTEQNRKVFEPYCKNVQKVPIPCHLTGMPYINLDRKKTYTFYSVYNWTERKSPLESLLAYCLEFSPTDNVDFLIKIKGASPGIIIHKDIKEMLISNGILSHPKFEIIQKAWTDKELDNFHRRNHCYVSLSKGEGWNLPLMDAYLAGNQIVSTHPCGFTEYLGKVPGFYPVKSKDGKVENMEWFNHVDDSHKWMIPDIKSARKSMRTAYKEWEKNPSLDMKKINKRNEDILKVISPQNFVISLGEALSKLKHDK